MKKHNGIFLGFSLPDIEVRQIFAIDTTPSVQTHKFAWSMARSLKLCLNKVFLISACPIQTYPHGRRVLFGGGNFQEDGIDGYKLPFINLFLIKHISRFISCALIAPYFLYKIKANFIFIHGVHTPFLIFGVLAKIFFRSKIVVILTDPPGVFSGTDGRIVRLLKRADSLFVRFFLRWATGVIALSPDLASKYAPKIPCLIFPGIANSVFLKNFESSERIRKGNEVFTIVYAGGVCGAYGVDRLVSAILQINDVPVCLRVFGRGDYEAHVRDLAASDARIFYGGFVGDGELAHEFYHADLLINPRPSSLDLSVMSFPSKLIEYLLSGRPVLTTMIKSIPENYKKFYNYIDDESVAGIRHSIISIISEDAELREAMALNAKEFVEGEISEEAVGKMINFFVGKMAGGL